MDPLSIGGLVTGLIGGIGSLFGAGKANKELKKLLGQDPTYQANPIAGQRLGFARSLLNARMPGTSAAYQSVLSNQANTMGQLERNATDSSQLLAMQGAINGQTNQGLLNAGQMENENYFQKLNYLTGAEEGAIKEGDKVYQDQVRRFEDAAKIQGAIAQNRQNSWKSLTDFGMGAFNMGMYGNMFGTGNSIFGKSKATGAAASSGGGGGGMAMTPSEYLRTLFP